MVRIISFAHICFLLLSAVVVIEARQYTKCELFNELTQKHLLGDEEAAKWTCIGGGVSNFNTSFRLGDLEYGVLGVFGIQAVFWCSVDGFDDKICGVTCDKFIDDDITDDLRCAKEFVLKDYGGSYNSWYKYKEENCGVKWMEIVNECKNSMNGNESVKVVDDKPEISTTSVRTVELEATLMMDDVSSTQGPSTTVEISKEFTTETTTEAVKAENSTFLDSTTQNSTQENISSTTFVPLIHDSTTTSTHETQNSTQNEFSSTTVSQFIHDSTSQVVQDTSTTSETTISTTNSVLNDNETTTSVPLAPYPSSSATESSSTTPEVSSTEAVSSTEQSFTSTTAKFDEISTTLTPNSLISASDLEKLKFSVTNPCKFMQTLKNLQNLSDYETTTWTCLMMNMISCYHRNESDSCLLTCEVILSSDCRKLSQIVTEIVQELPKEALMLKDVRLNECQSLLSLFTDNWCRITNPLDEVTSRISTENVTKEPEATTIKAEIVQTVTEIVSVTSENHVPETSTSTTTTTTVASIPETTTRGAVTLNSSEILKDPCGTLFFIAQNYEINKAEAAIWLCILRDLTFCQYNCQVDCNTAKRYGLNRANYCDELSLTIQNVFESVKPALTPLFSLIPFNNCQTEIFPFAVGLCPQLDLLKN